MAEETFCPFLAKVTEQALHFESPKIPPCIPPPHRSSPQQFRRLKLYHPLSFSWTHVVCSSAVRSNLVKIGVNLDIFVGTSLVDFYTAMGDLNLTKKVFEDLPDKDEVTRYAMLSSYVNKFNDMGKARDLFEKIPCKDLVIWDTIILEYVKAGESELAKKYFDRAPVKDLLMFNTILGCLAKNGEVECLLRLFHELPCRDLVSWNTIIGGLAGALDTGMWLHSYIDRRCSELNIMIGTALVDMYCKSGDLESAGWLMRKKCFYGMSGDFGLTPKLEHYGCMVDLLGRAGLLDEAYNLIQSMLYEPHAGAWSALLGACKIHRNVELAEKAIEHLIKLDLEDGGYLTIMFNIYANA
ncbi:pentatricopeptide repeat-containing protein At4g02750-like [Solanum dulcamara]|uniref:pentatricopeptide repeat-containing protein At4g02750-like n=1 Tax=Solanum dulcamara TaxID=45834 RepID=UPI0024853618|nr:pentatricopeptide repeat-containing protein At4g02750-like [Solanum dulcamara]